MRSFVWSLQGSILTVLILWGYISAFNWVLPRYVKVEMEARVERQEQEQQEQEEAERAAEQRHQAMLEASKAQYEALGLSFPGGG